MRAWVIKHKSIVVGVALTALMPLLMAVKDLDVGVFSDPSAWLLGVGMASARQVAVYLLSKLPLE